MHASATAFPWGEAERRRLVRLCASLSGDADAAEDLAQETLLEGWRNAHKLNDRDGAERWLAAIARNVCLRWGRRAGRAAAVEAAVRAAAAVPDAGEELDHADLAALLNRALGSLPPDARDLLSRRYVDGTSAAELAEALGIGEDALSMRLARAKAALRHLLATTLRDESTRLGLAAPEDDAWQATRIWCGRCGARRLLARTARVAAIAFRCPGCEARPSALGSEYRLDNPVFSRLLGGVVRPTAILARAAEWSQRYFSGGAGTLAACTRCERPVTLGRYRRDTDGPHRHGLHATCDACGEAVSSSLGGLALTLTEVRRLRREHPRTIVGAVRELDFGGTPALVAEVRTVTGSVSVTAVYARDTLRLLDVR